jgi:tetraacyldisaccharide 4'-kinase
VPVVVVGNVVAGGSGKTPVVMAVIEHLRAQGWRPGVVSRGHGRLSRGCLEVLADMPARDCGDEPLLIRQRCQVPVFVASLRAQAAGALLKMHPDTNILVADDGLQHHALARDINIAVFDDRGTGNGWLLPAGPLREPWQPDRVNLVLHTGQHPAFAGFQASRSLATHGQSAQGQSVPLHSLKHQRLMALAGIAQPEAFFDMLRQQGLTLEHTLALPDHHDCQGHRSRLFCRLWTPCWPHSSANCRIIYHLPMDTRLLELLVCPVTKGHLEYDKLKQELISRSARLAYPVRDGLPVMLESQARTLSDQELGL